MLLGPDGATAYHIGMLVCRLCMKKCGEASPCVFIELMLKVGTISTVIRLMQKVSKIAAQLAHAIIDCASNDRAPPKPTSLALRLVDWKVRFSHMVSDLNAVERGFLKERAREWVLIESQSNRFVRRSLGRRVFGGIVENEVKYNPLA